MSIRWFLALIIAIGLTAAPLARPAGGTAHAATAPAFSHIYVIMEENTSYEDLIGNTADAPYINSLASTYGFAANYYGVTHPSMPNYVATIAGDYFGVNKDDPKATFTAPNVVDQLESKGLTWATYQQGMPAVGSTAPQNPSTGSGLYVNKHNPFVLFTDVNSNPARLQNLKPIESLSTDLNSGKAPNFSLIVPDQCHDMHGVSSSSAASYGMPWCAFPPNFVLNHALIQTGDAYLKQLVTTIMTSKGWTSDSVIAVTWDEGESSGLSSPNRGYASNTGCCASPPNDGGGRVPFVLITNTPQHTVSLQPYNHYSLLRTIEDNWGLPCLANTCNAAVHPMTDLISPTAATLPLPLQMTQGVAISFISTRPGQGYVLFGTSCNGLVETATRDIGAGTTNHTVLVQGNDLPGTVGDNGLVPGTRYYYAVQSVSSSGVETDDNGGQCYSVVIAKP